MIHSILISQSEQNKFQTKAFTPTLNVNKGDPPLWKHLCTGKQNISSKFLWYLPIIILCYFPLSSSSLIISPPMTFDSDIIIINSLRLLLCAFVNECSWNLPAAYHYIFKIININIYIWLNTIHCLMVTIYFYWFWNFTILIPFFIIIDNFRHFKCYTCCSLIKGLLRSSHGLIMGRSRGKSLIV